MPEGREGGAEPSNSSNLQQEDGDQVIPDDFSDFLGNTTYLPGLPITNIIKID